MQSSQPSDKKNSWEVLHVQVLVILIPKRGRGYGAFCLKIGKSYNLAKEDGFSTIMRSHLVSL